jgi:hypothetical protein
MTFLSHLCHYLLDYLPGSRFTPLFLTHGLDKYWNKVFVQMLQQTGVYKISTVGEPQFHSEDPTADDNPSHVLS